MKNLQIPLFYNYHFKFERLRKKGCYTNIYCFVYSFYLFHNSYFTLFHIKIFKTRLFFFRQRLLLFFFVSNKAFMKEITIGPLIMKLYINLYTHRLVELNKQSLKKIIKVLSKTCSCSVSFPQKIF